MFYSAASNNSLWRGVHYYKEGNVVSFKTCDQDIIKGIVSGSEDNFYDTTIDLAHPKKSTCNCPFADGRRVICKHMIALYFTAVPNSFELFERDMNRLETHLKLEEERWRKETRDRIEEYVAGLTAKEARETLVDVLYQSELNDRYRNDDYWEEW